METTWLLDEIERQRDTLAVLCRRFRVHRLAVFGSAVTGEFRPGESDLDFLVEFEPGLATGHADRYFGLLEALEALFEHKVDLVVASAIRNPYFLEAIERTERVLYAA
ncbi:MAG: nucleotidyltransferase [Anaerolineae bacterium]|nr:MAG: nucleotidyltransferase [Anaerolineae bacterium]